MAGTSLQKVSLPGCGSSHAGKLCLQLDCSSDCLYVLRSIVDVMSARAGMNELQSNRVAIAVDEVFANIAVHAYAGAAGRVELETYFIDNEDHTRELVFDFRDYAATRWDGSFEDLDDWAPDAKTLCSGGLGLKLIHSAADYCQHNVLADGNHWRLGFVL